MKRALPGSTVVLALAALVLAATGCGDTKTVTETVTVPATAKSGAAPPSERVEYGHIVSLAQEAGRYLMRFDPAWLLSGEAANTAAAEDGAVPPGEPVPNDNYVVEEGHRELTYVVADDAEVTVLTKDGDPAQLGATLITVAELAEIVNGTSSIELYEPLDTGVWITVDIDIVRAIYQQYKP
jgi:hypothetical protein